MPEIFIIWLKYRKPVILFCSAAVLLSVIVSMPVFMPPYYESKTIFYPSNPSLSDRNALFNEDGSSQEYFGGKSDVDRVLSIAQSQPLADSMIHRFDLKEHYDIKGSAYYVRREFDGNYKPIKNSLGAVEIVVFDKDPQFAAQLSKAIVGYIDSTNLAMMRSARIRTLQAFEQAQRNKEAELQSITDTLSKIKDRHNVKMSTEGFIISGDNAYAVEQARILQGRQNSLITELTQINRIKSQNAMVADDHFSTLYIVEDATPAEKKSKPVRWMIVLGTALAAFFAATLFAIVLELLQRVRRSE